MGKFGKKSTISSNIYDYSVCILGESGIGKTTLMKNVCEKLVGEDGYIILDTGKEDGVKCIEGAVYETVQDYKKFDEVITDIVKNKETDYPDLKIIVVDTLDQLFAIAEPKVIAMYNHENMGKKDFTPAKTINQAYGGFGRGEDKVIDIILDKIWQLRNAGVMLWCNGHTKKRDIDDPLSGMSYSTLSTNMMQRYFNAIKTKFDIVGVACIDRTIVAEKTGKKNIITKKEETVNKVKEEKRIIKFRDDNYSVDSKSRFATIVDEISLDTDALINAITEAIKTSSTENKPVVSVKPKAKPVAEPEPEIEVEDEDEVQTVTPEELIAEIKEKNTSDETRKAIIGVLKSHGEKSLAKVTDIAILTEILDTIG